MHGEHVRDSQIQKGGTFSKNLQAASPEVKDFYILWVDGGSTPVRRKYEHLEDAKDACNYLINDRGVKEVFIMKKVGIAYAPRRVDFRMD